MHRENARDVNASQRDRSYALDFASHRLLILEQLESRLCLSSVPAFESLPGAAHTIFLDYDGHTVQNTGWNSYYNQATLIAQPYDIDGDSGTFSATELARIEESYHRVAEDFRAFNVNVTTIEPSLDKLQKSGSSDTQWGLRVIITNESTMVTDPNERTGAGGIAYIDSFNSSIDLPVWVYTTGGKSIAEAASHEAGHALGLSHDGTPTASYYTGHGSGDTGWASIMGVGYYKNVTQWDDGTYFGSNNGASGSNYGKGADDLQIITTYNGFGYRADDHGNTNAGASSLGLAGTVIDDEGIIETSADKDVFSFTTGAGQVTLNVDTFLPGPNLDILAELYDSNGVLISSSNPASGLNASITVNLAAGQYYLHVDGVGVGDPTVDPPTGYSDYSSIGSYVITGGIVDPGQAPQLSVDDVTVNEGDGTAVFTVSLNGSISTNVTVDYATANNTALAGSDFTAVSGSLTFVPGGAATQSVVVSIIDDTDVEGDHDFLLNLSSAVGASVSDGQGVGTITDNDANVSIGDVAANEGNPRKGKKQGNPNYKDFVFVVSLSNAVGHDVDVNWSTQDGSATTADNDYLATSGTLTITAGSLSGTVVVQVVGDGTQEADETFHVNIDSVTGATVDDGVGDGIIEDDDTKKGGGGRGGGNGGGNRAPWDYVVVKDEFWYFEGGHDHGGHDHSGHHHGHDHHNHGHDGHHHDGHEHSLGTESGHHLGSGSEMFRTQERGDMLGDICLCCDCLAAAGAGEDLQHNGDLLGANLVSSPPINLASMTYSEDESNDESYNLEDSGLAVTFESFELESSESLVDVDLRADIPSKESESERDSEEGVAKGLAMRLDAFGI